ncbi:hypothetical protein YC2023_025507 [Brassica napus]
MNKFGSSQSIYKCSPSTLIGHPIKPSTLYCTSPPATADIVPPQLELNLGGRGDACYQIPMACPIYYLDLMGIGDGSRAVPLPMSLACSSPVMHVAAKMACGG